MHLPTREMLLGQGLFPDEIPAVQIALADKMSARDSFIEAKPCGGQLMKWREDLFYEEQSEPFKCYFNAAEVPSGLTQRQHFEVIPQLLRGLSDRIVQNCRYYPKCALVSPEITGILEIGMGPFLRGGPDLFGNWRRKIGTFFENIELHVEPDCQVPYLLPRGEMWLMFAWRYDDPVARTTQWARPIGVLRFEGYTDNDMVHIAKCAR